MSSRFRGDIGRTTAHILRPVDFLSRSTYLLGYTIDIYRRESESHRRVGPLADSG